MKRTRLRPESLKRRNERAARSVVRHLTLLRAEYRCEGASLCPRVACGLLAGRAPLEVHEVIGRGVHPGAHLDVELTMALCPAHHDWATTHPHAAHQAGLRYHAWEVDLARARHPAHPGDLDPVEAGENCTPLRLVLDQ